jgi:hypothetical protein
VTKVLAVRRGDVVENGESSRSSSELDPSLNWHNIEIGSMFAARCKTGEIGSPFSSISPKAYCSSLGENKARASDSVIHPLSPSYKTLRHADNANSSTALSLRASRGVDAPSAKTALMDSHIPITTAYIEVLKVTTA